MKLDKKNIKILLSVLVVIVIGIIYISVKDKSNNYNKTNKKVSKSYMPDNYNKDQDIYYNSEEIKNKNLKESEEENKQKNNIKVYISGEVENSGVYEIDNNSRIIDVIELAGNLTKDADTENINLASFVKDGQHIKIPKIGEEVKVAVNNTENNNIININEASLQELMSMPGIGQAKAENIIRYRESNGNFSKIEDIKNVNGIGNALFENIKSLICT